MYSLLFLSSANRQINNLLLCGFIFSTDSVIEMENTCICVFPRLEIRKTSQTDRRTTSAKSG